MRSFWLLIFHKIYRQEINFGADVMNFLKRLAGPTAIGLFLAVIGLILSIYTDYFRKQISLSMIIDNEINVFSVNERIQNLDIFFRGRNISLENLALKFIRVKVENNGSADILQNLFDVSKPWGLTIENGEIVEARVLNSTSDYIKENLNIKISSLNSVEWEKVILESAESFTVEILVASSPNMPSTVRMLGKIAGIPDIDIVNRQSKEESAYWLREVFYGNAVIQFARLLIFFFITIIMLLAIALIISVIDKIGRFFQKAKRRKIVRRYSIYFRNIDLDEYYQQLCDIFVDEGRIGLFSLRELLSDQDARKATYDFYNGKDIIPEDDLELLGNQIRLPKLESQTSPINMTSEHSLEEIEPEDDFSFPEDDFSFPEDDLLLRSSQTHAIANIEDYFHEELVASISVTKFFIVALRNNLIVRSEDQFKLSDTIQSLFNHLINFQK